MPTYITLARWTDQGIRNVKQSLDRLEAAKKAAKAGGGEIKAAYYTMGSYDVVVVSEAPDDETATRQALAAGTQGNIRTETLRAYTEAEFRKLIGSLP